MTTKRALLLFFTLVSLTSWAQVRTSGRSGTSNDAFERQLFHQAHEALTEVIVADIFSPPVASRIYVYAHAAAYETLVATRPGRYRSAAGLLPRLTAPPALTVSGYQPALAATEALLTVGRGLVFSEQRLDSAAATLWQRAAKQGYPTQTIAASRAAGRQMAVHIMAWAAGDNYRQTRSLRRYTPQKK